MTDIAGERDFPAHLTLRGTKSPCTSCTMRHALASLRRIARAHGDACHAVNACHAPQARYKMAAEGSARRTPGTEDGGRGRAGATRSAPKPPREMAAKRRRAALGRRRSCLAPPPQAEHPPQRAAELAYAGAAPLQAAGAVPPRGPRGGLRLEEPPALELRRELGVHPGDVAHGGADVADVRDAGDDLLPLLRHAPLELRLASDPMVLHAQLLDVALAGDELLLLPLHAPLQLRV
mmetsp:Transcript_66460/g.183597  ORF Transcript_66460/g.183597 Transcript_66460/m.183597 type:complete len:235 (+) Transcript_66460:128-832(+)